MRDFQLPLCKAIKPLLVFLEWRKRLQSKIKIAAPRRFLSSRKWPRGLCRISWMGCSFALSKGEVVPCTHHPGDATETQAQDLPHLIIVFLCVFFLLSVQY